MNEEERGRQVQELAIKLGEYLSELEAPYEIGLGALALAASAKVSGMTPHETISRFTSSVKSLHKELP